MKVYESKILFLKYLRAKVDNQILMLKIKFILSLHVYYNFHENISHNNLAMLKCNCIDEPKLEKKWNFLLHHKFLVIERIRYVKG